MNTKKFFFAVAAFGMLAAATYVPNTSADDQSTSIDRKTPIEGRAKK